MLANEKVCCSECRWLECEVCFVLGRCVIFCRQECVYLDGISVVDWSVCGFRLENEIIAGVSFVGRCVGIGWSVFVSCDAL